MSEGGAALHPRPVAAAGSCPRPAAGSCGCRSRSDWSMTRPGRSCSIPTAASSTRCSHLFADVRSGPGRRARSCMSSTASGLLFPTRIRKGAAQRRARVERAAPLAGAAHAAQPQVRRRVRVWPHAGPGKPPTGRSPRRTLPREQWTALIPDAHPGYLTWEQFEQNQRPLADNAHAHGHRPCRRPRSRRSRAAARPRDLRPLREPDERPLSPTPRHARTRLSMHRREHPGRHAPRCQARSPGTARRRHDQPAAARHRHAARARGRAHRPSRARSTRRRSRPAPRSQSSAPAITPSSPAAATSPSTPTTGSSPTPSKPTGTTSSARSKPPKTTTNAPPPPPTPQLTEQHKTRIRQLAADFPALWSDPATPQRERKRIARLLIEDVTLNRTDQIHLHVRFRGGQTTSLTIPIPTPIAWQPRQTNPDMIAIRPAPRRPHRRRDRPTCSTPTTTAPTTASRSPATSSRLRRAHKLRSHHDRLHAPGLLTLDEIARATRRAPHTIKAWRRAGLLTSRKANDRNEQLYDPPDPGDPRLVKHLGQRLVDRELIQTGPGGAL